MRGYKVPSIHNNQDEVFRIFIRSVNKKSRHFAFSPETKAIGCQELAYVFILAQRCVISILLRW